MVTMKLDLLIEPQRLLQQVQIQNEEIEKRIAAGIDQAIKELSEDGVIENMVNEAAKKAIMDSFSRWIFQSDIRKNIETQITGKMSEKIETLTTKLVNEVAAALNLSE